MSIAFEKRFTSEEDIVELLCKRGLRINNSDDVIRHLRHIGYYRFSAYLYPLLEKPKAVIRLSLIQVLRMHFLYPNVDIRAMGFHDSWLNEPLWC